MKKPECLFEIPAIVGECPTWCERKQVLYWVDILGMKLHCFDFNANQNHTHVFTDMITAIALCEDENKLLLCLQKDILLYDLNSRNSVSLISIETDLPDNRFNDAKCDPAGRFWAGTMNRDKWDHPDGALYCCYSGTQYDKAESAITCANGMGWSPDNRTMYFTDSFRYTVFAYDYDLTTGQLNNKRAFCILDPNGGTFSDGLTVDAEGHVWCAHMGPGQVVRYNPEGKLVSQIQLPVSRCTSCTFGGPEMKTLFMTTAAHTLTPDQLKIEPLAGSLFAIETNIAGLASYRIPTVFYKDFI